MFTAKLTIHFLENIKSKQANGKMPNRINHFIVWKIQIKFCSYRIPIVVMLKPSQRGLIQVHMENEVQWAFV